MRLRTTATKNGRLFYVIKTYYDSHGKEHSLTVEKLGNENDIRAKYGMDPDQWAKAHTAKLNEKEKIENKPLEVSFSPSKRLEKNAINTFEVGYLFLQSLYQELGIDKICKKLSKKYDFEYDLNSILSRLLYGRILHPCSKLSTTKFAATLLEKPNFQEHQVYRALDIIAKEPDFIQSELFSNSFALGKRHTGVIYYDCTNYFFEMEQAEDDTLPQYGKGKENLQNKSLSLNLECLNLLFVLMPALLQRQTVDLTQFSKEPSLQPNRLKNCQRNSKSGLLVIVGGAYWVIKLLQNMTYQSLMVITTRRPRFTRRGLLIKEPLKKS